MARLRRDAERNPKIGCIVLTDPFYLQDAEAWPAPEGWPTNIVSGKAYDVQTRIGTELFEKAKKTMALRREPPTSTMQEESLRYGTDQLIKPRLGQGGFRIVGLGWYKTRRWRYEKNVRVKCWHLKILGTRVNLSLR